MAKGAQQAGNDKTAVRPFHVNVPEAEVTAPFLRPPAAWGTRTCPLRTAPSGRKASRHRASRHTCEGLGSAISLT